MAEESFETRNVMDMLDELEDNFIEEANKLEKSTQNICKMKNRLLNEIRKNKAICKEHNLTTEQIDMVMQGTQEIVDICVKSASLKDPLQDSSPKQSFESYKEAVEQKVNGLQNEISKINTLREMLNEVKELEKSQ